MFIGKDAVQTENDALGVAVKLQGFLQALLCSYVAEKADCSTLRPSSSPEILNGYG